MKLTETNHLRVSFSKGHFWGLASETTPLQPDISRHSCDIDARPF